MRKFPGRINKGQKIHLFAILVFNYLGKIEDRWDGKEFSDRYRHDFTLFLRIPTFLQYMSIF
jgi:hypothetical protein